MTVQEAHVKARQEADRIVNEMQEQYHTSQTLVIVNAQNEEARAFENFKREAEEQHQVIMQERLGEAQSLGAEKLGHKEILKGEQVVYSERLAARVNEVEENTSNRLRDQGI